jgi:HEPN domain-containing protein
MENKADPFAGLEPLPDSYFEKNPLPLSFSKPTPEQQLKEPSLTEQFDQLTISNAVSSLVSSQGVSPDDTLRAKEIGSFLEVPEGLVATDMKKHERDYAYKKNYLTIKDNNDLLAWASDPDNVKKTIDDLDALKAISDKSKPSQSVLPYFTEGVSNFAQGAIEGPSIAQKEKYEALTWMSDISNGNPPTKFDAVKPSDSWMYSSGEFVTKFPTSIGLSALSESTNKRAIQGGIGGGVIGSALPLVGTTAGALVGSGSGAVVGIAEDQALQSAGMIAKEAYDNAINAGKTHEEAIPIAQQAMLTSWGANLALGIFPAMSGAKALVNPILGNATNSVVRTMLASGVENAVVGGVTEAVNVGAVEIAKEQSGMDSLLSNPTSESMMSALQRIGTASALGGIGGSALTGAMAGTGRLISRFVNKAPKALNHEQILTGVLDSMANSKTLVRDPETFREFTKFVLSETDFHTVDVPYDTLYNQMERNPDLWRAVFPDIDQRLETAGKTGENISLNTASFLTYFQNEARELLPQVLTDPDGMTADEARETLKVLPQQVQDDLNAFVEKLNEKQTDTGDDYRAIIYKDVIKKLDDGGFDNNPNFKGKDKNGIAMIALQRAIGRSIQRYGTPDNALNEYNRSPFVFQFLKEGEGADARAMDAYNEFQGNPKPTVIDPNEERYKDILTFTSGKKAVGLSAIKRLGKIKSDDEARGVLARLEQEGIIAPANKAGSHTVIANAKKPPKVAQPTPDPIGDSVSPVEPEPIVTPEPTPEPEPAPQSEPEPPVTKVKATKAKPAKAKKSKEKAQEPESISEPKPEEATPSTPVLSYEKGDYWVQSRGDLGYEIYKNTDDLSERVAVIEEAGDEGLTKAKAWIGQNDGTAPEFDVKNQGEYGRITAFKDFSVIQIFQKGDVATISHEFGHKFLDEFFFDAMDATLTNKDTTLIEDFESTKKWMYESRETLFDFEIKANPASKTEIDKIKARGDDYIKSFIEGGLKSKDSTDAFLKTILHEGWARSFEWYIKEGKAPNKGLRGTFIRFGNLIKAIYKGIKDYGVPLSPEIKLVFDRLLATDDKVNQLTAEYGIDPMFKDGATSGMDDASHTGYVKKYATIFGEISDKLRKRAMKAVTERKTRVGKEEMFAIRQRLMDESDASPEMQTFRAITEDEDLKIKPSDAQAIFGIDPALLPKEVLSEDGVSPDLVAQRLGYGTAREMGQHLADLESMRKSVTGNKDINMEDARRLSVERKAMDEFSSLKDAEHQSNPEQELFDSRIAEVLTDELNHLRSLQDGESMPIDPSAFKASARKLFGSVGNKDASRNYKKYINSAKRNGKKAQEFFDKGKYDIASKYKQQQIMSMFLAKEARDFGKRVRQTERLVKRISRNKTINGVSHAHMELLHTLLNDSGITTARSVRKSREGYDKPTLPESFAKALKKFRETDEWGTRADVYIGETLESGAKDWDNLTVNEYDDLSNTIFSIFQNGKNEGFIEIEGAKLEFDATIGQLAKLAGDVGKATPDTRGKMSEDEKTLFQEKRDKARSFLRKIIADTTKAETLFNQFDRYDPDGLWNKLNQQIQDGVEGVYNFWEGLDNIMDNFKDEVKGGKHTSLDFERWSQSLQKPVSAPDIYLVKNNYNPLTHNDDLPPDLWNPTRISLINIALHFGTPENMEKLIAGMGYTDNTKQPTGWTKERIEKLVFDNLTEIDWKFIQYLSKHVGSNWSKIVETQTKIHGFAPAEVITAPVNTPFGMIDGWYWPLVYDDAFEKSVLHEDKMLGGLFDDITPSGGTKERLSGVVKPIALDFNRVIRRVKKDVYYAHMAIPLKNMAKVLGHNKIKKAITYSKGEIYHAQLKDWVKDMANTGRRTVGEKDYVDLIQSRLLTGIYANLFGYAIKPVVDSTTDIVTAPLEFGPSSSAKAMSWLFAHRVLDLGKFLGKETGLFKASDLIFATEWHKNATPSQVDSWMSQFYTHNMRKGGADKRYMEFKNKMVNKWGLSGRVFDAVTRMGFGLIEFSEGVRNAIYARASYDSYTKKNPNATPEQVKNYVNKMIRKSSPARDIADKALIQRSTNNGQLKKMISFSTALLNRLYDDIGQAKMHWKDGKKGSALGAIARGMPRRLLKTGLSVGLVIKASLINMIYGASYQYLSGLYEQDKDDKDDAVEMLIKANIGGVFGNYPYFRDYYDVATNKSPVAGSSLGIQDSALKGAVKTTSGIVRGNKEFDEEAIVDFVEAFGSLSGLPVKRPTALFRWTDGVTSGEIQYDENDSFSQKLNDMQRGKKIER